MRIRSICGAVVSVALLVPTLAGAVLDPAIKCQAAKLKLAGKYASCRLLTDSAAVRNGTTADYSTCDSKLAAGWQKVEDSLGTECPTTGDLDDVQDSIVECLPATHYRIHFHLTSDDYLGGLEFDTDYSLAPGGFPGSDSAVDCTHMVPGTIAVYKDDESTETLTIGVIDQEGDDLVGPREIGYCEFETTGLAAPVPGDFTLTVIHAIDTNGFEVPGTTVAATVEKVF